jgi:hypothetical protein
MSALVERIIAARDALKGLNISDFALIREAREALAEAANGLDAYAKTMTEIEAVDRRVVAVLMWMDERGRNSRSFGSHAAAYEIAARKLREALSTGAPDQSASRSEAIAAQVDGESSPEAKP